MDARVTGETRKGLPNTCRTEGSTEASRRQPRCASCSTMPRRRISLLEQRNEIHNHIRDLFETASIKLSSVVSDLMGVTGKLLKKERLVKESLKGCFTDFHRS